MADVTHRCKECGRLFAIYTNLKADEGAFDDDGKPICYKCLNKVTILPVPKIQPVKE